MTQSRTTLRLMAALALVTALSGCVAQFRNHGFAPTDDDLAEILVGVDTRDTVADVIGPPTTGGVLTDGGFYYVESRWRFYGPFEPEIIDRQLVAVSFDEAGVVENIERFTLQDGRVVALSRRVTSSNVRDTSFVRQLLGNIGRIDETLLGG